MAGKAAGTPFFLDRSLGRFGVAIALRAAGKQVQTLAEIYGVPADELVADVDWLELAGTNRWPVLMKDQRIRRRPAERRALLAHGVQAFCLTNGNLRIPAMAEQFLSAWRNIEHACTTPGPYLYAVSHSGLRRVELDP